MTSTQFNAVAKLLRMRGGLAQDAAGLVLLQGMRKADAARSLGISPMLVNNAVTRMQKGLALAKLAA